MEKLRVAVIGAGPSGLVAAHLLTTKGAQVALFDSHSKPGGCASFFGRNTEAGRVVFDAGATVLNRMGQGEFLGELFKSIGVPLKPYRPMREMRFVLPKAGLVCIRTTSHDDFLADLKSTFPDQAAAIDQTLVPMKVWAIHLSRAFEKIPHLPLERFSDLIKNLDLVGDVLPLVGPLVVGLDRSFGEVLDRGGVSGELRRLIDMTCLITLQAPASEVSPLYGAMALFFYSSGCGALEGGMRGLFDSTLKSLAEKPGAFVSMRNRVTKILIQKDSESRDRYYLETMLGVMGPFDGVISTIPRMDTEKLFDGPLFVPRETLAADQVESDLWGAGIAYVVVEDRTEFSGEPFNLHSTLDTGPGVGDAYLSFSARGDLDRAPAGYRAVTMSNHQRLGVWKNLERGSDEYNEQKTKLVAGLLAHLEYAYPGTKVIFSEGGTPKSFVTYTRRDLGSVGGVPLTMGHSLFQSFGQRTDLQNVYQIGDTSFPGQSVYACAVGACAVVEKIFGSRVV